MAVSSARGRSWARAVAVAVVVGAGAQIPLDRAAHQLSVANTGFALMIASAFAVVGAILIARLPANPVGWLFSAFALVLLAGDCAGDYALLGYRYGHPSLPARNAAAVLATLAVVAPILILPLPIMLFPDGRLSGRWHIALRAYLAVAIGYLAILGAAAVVAVLQRHVALDDSGALARASGSSGADAWFASVKVALLVPAVPLGLSPFARQLSAYRSSGGLARVQLKWLLTGAAGSMVAVAFFVAGLGNGSSVLDAVFSTVAGGLLAALPVCMGVAILRYRLYEIDRLISRTLSYAILTGLLAAAFVGVVTLSTDVLPFSSRVGVAASTLVAVALFNPLRVRIQRLVDRRFNRARYDAQATVAAFTARLRDAVELEAVRAELLEVVREAVQPSHASIWLR